MMWVMIMVLKLHQIFNKNILCTLKKLFKCSEFIFWLLVCVDYAYIQLVTFFD